MRPTITRCTTSDVEHVAEVITLAFADNPVTSWLAAGMGADVDRDRLFGDYFRIFAEHALRAGEVEATGDGVAVALWFRPDSGEPPDAEARLAAVTGRHLARFRALHGAMDDVHPRHDVHHLAFLAVLPEFQCRGHGSALLRYHHARLDELRLPAYLESSAPRNRALYEREGYRRTGELIQPVGAPPLWPMIRPPDGAR